MKLEGELAIFHSKMGVEPESQSFEFKDGDQNSAGYKLQNQKAKEYENRVSINLKKNEWELDPSPYGMKPADCMAAPKLEFYNSIIDLKSDHEAHVADLVEPKSHSSKDKRGLDPSPHVMESAACKTSPKLEFYDSMIDSKSDYEAQEDIGSFMKFQNVKQSVKKSPTSPISNPFEEIGKFQNSVNAYMDKTVPECEPELVVRYKDNNYHVVKDICVDDGVHTKHKFVLEDSVDGKAYNLFPTESFRNKEIQKDSTGVEVLNPPATAKSDQVSATHDQPNDVMHKDEDVSENLIGNASKDMVLPEDTQDSITSDDKGEQLSSEPELHSQSKGSKNLVEEAVMARPALGLAVDESNSDGTGSFTYQFEPLAPAECGKKELHQLGGCNCDEPHHSFKPLLEGHPYDHGETSQVRNSLGESSFSVAGPVSGRISYSGSIPYSGSISIRSDSSNTSTRSFAFPILQSEWNSSPVRMAKPDRSRSRWRQGLLCCKF